MIGMLLFFCFVLCMVGGDGFEGLMVRFDEKC
jgi:hypothetical protein